MNRKPAQELRPGQYERIVHLFRRGYSLDLVAELGLIHGWGREQAKAVVGEQGWALDWTGRLQPQYLASPVTGSPSIEKADPERVLNAGIDHENTSVRAVARKAERAIEHLRLALMAQERRDAATAAPSAPLRPYGAIPLPRAVAEEIRAS